MEPGEPRLIWIKMPVRPFIKHTAKGYVFAQCGTFNKILEQTTSQYLNSHILEVDLKSDCNYFDLAGNLSSTGLERYWRDVNYQMKQFDRGDITLLPATTQKPTPHHKSSTSRCSRGSSHINELSIDRAYHKFHI